MNQPLDRTDRYCIVGAGASGLTVAKNFLAAGIAFDCLERNADIGGTWNFGQAGSAVYQSTHLISSKALTEYTDFPIPEDFPEFISHEQALAYLRAYAHAFGLLERIEFNVEIASIVPDEAAPTEFGPKEKPSEGTPTDSSSPSFLVTVSSGEVRRYRGVVIANGHNWDARWPTFPGHFSGTILHSSQYKTSDVLRGKRVLVIGGGNSGCDIACEAAQHAAKTFHSLRRGYHYLPKFLFGFPIDRCGERLLRWRLPLWLRRFVTGRMVKIALGSPETFGCWKRIRSSIRKCCTTWDTVALRPGPTSWN
jgi:cation diffusion facilitator CzcD-associated flavoprotein CzcO